MPAIDLTKLRVQVRELIDQSSNPDSFCKSLEFFLQQYKNYTLRNEKKYIGLDLPSYNTPSQVLSSITKELGKMYQQTQKLA